MTETRRLHCLIAGFEPFDKAAVNPSQQAVLSLPKSIELAGSGNRMPVSSVVLPTCCLDAWKTLEKSARGAKGNELILLLSGLADKRDQISLERFALNVQEYRIPDNQGHQWQEEYILQDGPEALRTKVNLRQLSRHLQANGFACEISNHAGTFVCNEIYYRSLQSWGSNPRFRAVLFVHLPNPGGYLRLQAKLTRASADNEDSESKTLWQADDGGQAEEGSFSQAESRSLGEAQNKETHLISEAVEAYARALTEIVRFLANTSSP